ncbi:MAG: sigma-70 family RNA polymerase sigma factor [Planctomycetota bacterium]
MSEVTQILQAIERGDTSTTDELLPLVYEELRRIATSKLKREAPGQTLQTTGLVHEAYLRLVGKVVPAADGDESSTDTPSMVHCRDAISWDSRGHFFAAAAESMRRILIDNARRKKQLKRGGELNRVEMESIELAGSETPVDLIALDEALTQLEDQDELKARIVKLRYFAGLTVAETAAAVGVSEPTVKRHWQYARFWLRRQLEEEKSEEA